MSSLHPTDAERVALRAASDARIRAKRRADALLVADMPQRFRRSPIGDPPKSYGSPWMEGRRRDV